MYSISLSLSLCLFAKQLCILTSLVLVRLDSFENIFLLFSQFYRRMPSLFSLSLSLFLVPTFWFLLPDTYLHTLEYNPLSHTQTSFSLFLILSSSSTVTHTLSYNPLSLSHPNTHTHKHLSLSLSNLHPPSCQNKSDYCGAFWNVGGCFSEIKPNLFTFKQCE